MHRLTTLRLRIAQHVIRQVHTDHVDFRQGLAQQHRDVSGAATNVQHAAIGAQLAQTPHKSRVRRRVIHGVIAEGLFGRVHDFGLEYACDHVGCTSGRDFSSWLQGRMKPWPSKAHCALNQPAATTPPSPRVCTAPFHTA